MLVSKNFPVFTFNLNMCNRLFPAILMLLVLLLAACGGVEEVEPTAAATEPIPVGTATPLPLGTATIPTSATNVIDERLTEVEWPPYMRLGDSDVVRLSIIPGEGEYIVITEFPEHELITDTVTFTQPAGTDLFLAGRLDSVGFSLSPTGDQIQDWRPQEPMIWRWTISPIRAGQHRLAIILTMHWRPQPGNQNPARQAIVFSKALNVEVESPPGATIQWVMLVTVVGVIIGVILVVALLRYRRSKRSPLQAQKPNAGLILEPHPDIALSSEENRLLQAVFRRYVRLVLDLEFRSGYSGARAFLTLPILADGRSDAYSVAKIGDGEMIEREYDNYKTYVEDTLPPVTARIQGRPIVASGGPSQPFKGQSSSLAAIRYTFIGEPGRKPVSLRQVLLKDPDPIYLEKLFRVFGPNWWMQRRPYTFRLLQEYDRKLPSHYILEPSAERGRLIDGRSAPTEVKLDVGDIVTLQDFELVERRTRDNQLSLRGLTQPGQAPFRIRWLSLEKPTGASARVVATRQSLLNEWTADFDRLGLPDPLARLPVLLNQKVIGTQSIIHGDLNLENVLVGPGDFVWLIDFANTREGHPLYDFSHLAVEIIAHIISPRFTSGAEFLGYIRSEGSPLLNAVNKGASQCLFDADQPREYYLALYLSCLGALKYRNLSPPAKYFLYLTAAWLVELID